MKALLGLWLIFLTWSLDGRAEARHFQQAAEAASGDERDMAFALLRLANAAQAETPAPELEQAVRQVAQTVANAKTASANERVALALETDTTRWTPYGGLPAASAPDGLPGVEAKNIPASWTGQVMNLSACGKQTASGLDASACAPF